MARKKNKRIIPAQPVSKLLIAGYSAAIVAGIKILRRKFRSGKNIMLSELAAGNLAPHMPVVPLHFPLDAKSMAEKYVNNLANNNRKTFGKAITSMTGTKPVLPVDAFDKMKLQYINENVSLIKSIPEKLHSQVADVIREAYQNATRPETLSKLIEQRFDVAESRARLIARDQLSKLNGDISKQNATDIGCDTYIWSTVQDERVRDEPDDSHRAMEGMLCKWEDDTVFSDDDGETWRNRSEIGGPEMAPGEDYNCRCVSLNNLPSLDKLKNMEDEDAEDETDPIANLQKFIDSQNNPNEEIP